MNQDSLAFTLTQISYLVSNLNKKNFTQNSKQLALVSGRDDDFYENEIDEWHAKQRRRPDQSHTLCAYFNDGLDAILSLNSKEKYPRIQ